MLPSALIDTFEQALREVGYSLWDSTLMPVGWLRVPANSQAWVGYHSFLLLVYIDVNEQESWKLEASMGARWLGDLIDLWWHEGRLMDGYLVIALSERPASTEAWSHVREFELKTHICRRHVVWPNEGDWSKATDEVTVAKLPEASNLLRDFSTPNLPHSARFILKMFEEHGGIMKSVLDSVEELIDSGSFPGEE